MKTDLEIQKNVIDELRKEIYIKSSDIGVSVKNGIVTLTGFVDSYSKKRLIESIVFRIEGMRVIADEIVVRFDTDQKITDTEIAQAILNALKRQNGISMEKIKVKIDEGWVTITGEVDWEIEKLNVSKTVESILGIKGVNNLITINPRAKMNIMKIKRNITAAFNQNTSIDANNIVVSGIRNTVILRGLVRSNKEKQEAEKIALNSQGVLNVDNRLSVVSPIFQSLN